MFGDSQNFLEVYFLIKGNIGYKSAVFFVNDQNITCNNYKTNQPSVNQGI